MISSRWNDSTVRASQCPPYCFWPPIFPTSYWSIRPAMRTVISNKSNTHPSGHGAPRFGPHYDSYPFLWIPLYLRLVCGTLLDPSRVTVRYSRSKIDMFCILRLAAFIFAIKIAIPERIFAFPTFPLQFVHSSYPKYPSWHDPRYIV